MVTVPIRDRASEDPAATTTMRVPLMLPHELLHFLSVPWKLNARVFFMYNKMYSL